MVINSDENKNVEHVEFVSYTGKGCTLCFGVLTVKIDGKEVKFGGYPTFVEKDASNFPRFWSSGGSCGFSSDYADSYVEKGEWVIDCAELPDEYKPYVSELDAVFNANVPQGCCGGCL